MEHDAIASEGAERAVLAICLLDPDKVPEVLGTLRREHFYFDYCATIYDAVNALDSAGRPIDILSLRQELHTSGSLIRVGGAAKLADILDSPCNIGNLWEYCRIILETYRRRSTVRACQEIVAAAHTMPLDAMEGLVDKLTSTGATIRAEDASPMSALVARAYNSWDPRGPGTNGIVTGLAGLDRIIVKFSPGNLIVLAARPGIGKTALAVNTIAHNVAASGAGVLVFELEMSKDELTSRLACSVGKIDSRVAAMGKLDAEQWRAAAAACDDISRLPLWVDDLSRSFPQMKSCVTSVWRKWARSNITPGLIVVDYLQLMRTGKARSREEGVSENSRELKAMAKYFDVPVIAISQMNREIEKERRKPRLSDLRESGAIEQDADVVMFLHGGDDEADIQNMEILVAKGRHFGRGSCSLRFERRYTRFTEGDVE